jgi:two-component system phosphate regulon sensor histidine kinase PhoR
MVEGVLVLDRDGEIRLSNRCAERLFGNASEASLVGRPLMSVSRDPDLQELVREVMREDMPRPSRREITLEGPGGESLQVSATAIGTPDSARLYILVFHDITELKKLEATRRDFVANVSHELRTPLTAIRGYAETLQSGALADVGVSQRFVEVIARHSERLSRLIDDLLTLSDLELGRTEIQLAPMSLDGAVAAAVELVREKAEQGRVRLEHEVASNTPMVLADPDRIEQLLVNLVDNAVKYTPEGGSVTVHAEANAGPNGAESAAAETPNGESKWVELKIVDTGIGIPKSELPRLTERFYRVDKARSRALGGTGLGLAIVKHIVQAHGGALKIDSDFGKGTCVFVYLPAAPSE